MLKTKNRARAVGGPFVTFSIRLPKDLVKRCEETGEQKLWSRNRVIEQSIVHGLPLVEAEAAR